MQGAARTLLIAVSIIGAVAALVLVAIEPAIFGLVVAVSAAVGWCLFLERGAGRPS